MRAWMIAGLLLLPAYGMAAGSMQVEQGRQVYLKCVMCHGPKGDNGLIGKPLSHQTRDELVRKLRAYRAGRIMGSTNATLMTFRVRGLSDAEIEAVAAYISEVLAAPKH